MATGVYGSLEHAGPRKRLRKSPFFTILGLILLALALVGFWPQYFSAVQGRTPSANSQYWMIHLHAALFTAWLLMYVGQAALIMTGRARVHLKLGPTIAAYGFAIAAVGILASPLLAHRIGVRENDMEAAAAFVFFPLLDMVFFAAFLAVAIIYRKVPHIHKRAMFLATFPWPSWVWAGWSGGCPLRAHGCGSRSTSPRC